MKTIVFETFRKIGSFEVDQLTNSHPSCLNGIVAVRKYRVTVEEMEEPKEVIAERIRKLWRECNNHHHWQPLKAAANSVGIELDYKELPHNRK